MLLFSLTRQSSTSKYWSTRSEELRSAASSRMSVVLLAVEDVGFGGLAWPFSMSIFSTRSWISSTVGTPSSPKRFLQFSNNLVADAFGLFAVFSAYCFCGFPNGYCYAFLIEWF